jgi:hypothetical protein
LASHRERCLLRTLAAGRGLRRLHAAAQHAGFNAPRLFINCQITSVTSGRQAPEILDLFPAGGLMVHDLFFPQKTPTNASGFVH